MGYMDFYFTAVLDSSCIKVEVNIYRAVDHKQNKWKLFLQICVYSVYCGRAVWCEVKVTGGKESQ